MDVTEASDSKLWKNAITAENGVITVRYALHTLQLSVHFFKTNSSAKDIVSKVRNGAKKTHKQNITELFKHNNKAFPSLGCENSCI